MAVIVNDDPTANDLGGDEAQKQPDSYFGQEEEDTQSPYNMDYLRFPHYYLSADDDEGTQGQWVLADALSCKVTWTMNQIPTLQMTYPRDGVAAKALQTDGIIMSDVNRILVHQKFRIKQIQKDGNQLVINATHIIGDIAGLTLSQNIQIPNCTATDLFNALQLNSTDWNPSLRFSSDSGKLSNVNIDMTTGNLSNYIFDADAEGDTPTQSLLGLFGGELTPDNYHLIHNQKAGQKTGIIVRYGRNIQTIQQDKNIENTYTAIYPYAKYEPAQAIATQTNVQWSQWVTDWSGAATVTYTAGGTVDIYDSPVAGHHKIGELTTGTRILVGKAVADGSFTPDGKFQINTVNGTTYYPISTDTGSSDAQFTATGWISANWINFSKSGDFLVNDAEGYIHTAIKDDDSKYTLVDVVGTGTVNWPHGAKKIREFLEPDGDTKTQKPTGKTMKDGKRFRYTAKAIDQNGDTWYRLTNDHWVYGPHVKVNSEQDITHYSGTGRGYVKKNAPVYELTKQGMKQKTKKSKKWSTRIIHRPSYKWVYRGRGKKRHKVKIKLKITHKKYHKSIKVRNRRGYAKIKGQVKVGDTIYYKLSNGRWVKKSSIDQHAKKTRLPKDPKEIDASRISKRGKIFVYDGPGFDMTGKTVDVNTGYRVEHMGTDGAGNTWYELTTDPTDPKDRTLVGWIPADDTDTSAVGDKEPSAPDEDDEDDTDNTDSNGNPKTNVDQSEVMVTVGLVYPDNPIDTEAPRIQNVDLSSYFKHDDQDMSGQQSDGTFIATDADKTQLEQIAQQYVKEHNIGVVPVSTTVNYEQFGGIQGDISAINMYDTVTVVFEKLGIQETAEVSSTVYDAMAHRYETVTIGDLPKSYEHLLLEASQKQTNELGNKVKDSFKHDNHLFAEMAMAVKEEGTARQDAVKKIADEVGIVNGQMSDVDKQIVTINQQEEQLRSDILNGGTQELQFLDASGNTNFLHPTQIRAVNSDGTYLDFNSEGLGFFDQNNNHIRSAIGADGMINAESIDASQINALNVKSAQLQGELVAGQGTPIVTYIATAAPDGAHDKPSYGGSGIWLMSDDYQDMVSSGRITIYHKGYGSISLTAANGLTWNGKTLNTRAKVDKNGYVDIFSQEAIQ